MPKTYRCFFCKEVFTETTAPEHFGKTIETQPLCLFTRDFVTNLEWQLGRYRNDDTDLHRKIATLETELHTKTQQANDKGYSDGLKDASEALNKLECVKEIIRAGRSGFYKELQELLSL